MGKRKKAAKKPTGPKKNEPLATTFPCLFCNHEKSVSVKLDKKAGVGQLSCKVCDQKFQCAINYLSAAVDVYSDWVDACDAVAKESEEAGRDFEPEQATAQSRPGASKLSKAGVSDDDDDDDILNDEDGFGGYRGAGVVDDDEY